MGQRSTLVAIGSRIMSQVVCTLHDQWCYDSQPILASVTVNTSSSAFYFVAGQSYTIDLHTDKYEFGGFQIAYPPEGLVQTGYTIGYDTNQANATVLNLWLTNRGNTTATLSAVTLQDSMSNPGPVTFPMNGPTVSKPGATVQITIDTLGSGFYFAHQRFYFLAIKKPRQDPIRSPRSIFPRAGGRLNPVRFARAFAN